MKKILFLSSLLLFPFSLVLAVGGNQGAQPGAVNQGQVQQNQGTQVQGQNQGVDSQIQTQNQVNTQQGNGDGVQVQGQNQVNTQNQGVDSQIQTQNQDQVKTQQGDTVKVQNSTQLKATVEAKKQELVQETEKIKGTAQKVYQNQNVVREAVHSLIAAEDLIGGIGQQVSAIAREVNNSVDKTIQAEEKIQKRNILAKLFVGGDKTAAQDLDQEVNQNKERIQTLNQLMESCNCQSETKQVLQEQIQNMEQEQNRLEELANKEKNSNGVFGWLVQLFK